MINLLQFLKEVLRDYAKRFWIFFFILYGAMVFLELSRQVFLESLSSATLFNLASPQLAGTLLINEILGKPYQGLAAAVAIFFARAEFDTIRRDGGRQAGGAMRARLAVQIRQRERDIAIVEIGAGDGVGRGQADAEGVVDDHKG